MENITSLEKESMAREAHESLVAYLNRMEKLITKKIGKETGRGILFDPHRTPEKDLPLSAQMLIAQITKNTKNVYPEKLDIKNNNSAALGTIGASISTHRVGSGVEPKDETTFDQTQRRRKFFETQPGQGAAKRETYWNTLFFPYNTESTRTLAKEILDNKTILLLGGGRSRIKEEMLQYNIAPSEVLNIDPFVGDIEPGSDTVISISATDENLPTIIKQQGFQDADEIWAEYSVPAYLDNPDEIKRLFYNIDKLLAPNGHARIWPAEIKDGTMSEIEARKRALLKSLVELAATEKYEVVPFKRAGRPGFVLHKIQKV